MVDKPKLDRETAQVLNEAQIYADLIESEGWKTAYKRFHEKFFILDSLTNLQVDDKSDMEIAREVKARRLAMTLILEWMNEILGTANQLEISRTGYYSEHVSHLINLETSEADRRH